MSDYTLLSTHDHVDYTVDWDRLSQIYTVAPLPIEQSPERLRLAYENSQVCCYAWQGDTLVGACRALADNDYWGFICDLVVDPSHQKQGLGRKILDWTIKELAVEKVILACVKGQEGFYEKAGLLRHTAVMALYPDAAWYLEKGILENVE
ncbi:MAG: GNAT family N-acetyltransferase [Gemmatimonadetes bacterium]|jgi:GNAT superfamily N-acetyltransferase|nr:GNAT family N-acetyltransferase [Gemmatimonadota bacterium]MBT5059533.1 GNAT family N-acetyltransferase [Gemmatimonadota bacterium]MBT5144303.1 GNAT family N-acetyltransferase [Gemmatimonadota bacterium]MBT5590031.1 GNAT family N-acetyltransferase [Gemmatimonadota bacterium]MBT5964619.1 GNAT family N-acetyltransferase [Gemmatimonadota bacterium]